MTLKERVLAALEDSRGESLSGERLARRFKVSRAAVWKAVSGLKAEGYRIEAVTNRGYALCETSDVLSAQGVRPHLKPEFKDLTVLFFDSLNSTNAKAKELLEKSPPQPGVIFAKEQSGGRGRLGRGFFSPPGGIYMSFILPLNSELQKSILITAAAGVAVCEAIEAAFALEPKIKWVNDIYLRDKKVCGILSEAVSDFESGIVKNVVLGIGINFAEPAGGFPAELKETAGALFSSQNAPPERNRLAAGVINRVLARSTRLDDPGLIAEYKRRSWILGEDIVYFKNGLRREGRAVDIDGSGGLVVQTEDAKEILGSGEITVRRRSGKAFLQ